MAKFYVPNHKTFKSSLEIKSSLHRETVAKARRAATTGYKHFLNSYGNFLWLYLCQCCLVDKLKNNPALNQLCLPAFCAGWRVFITTRVETCEKLTLIMRIWSSFLYTTWLMRFLVLGKSRVNQKKLTIVDHICIKWKYGQLWSTLCVCKWRNPL